MKFGRVENLDGIDFSLRAEDPVSTELFKPAREPARLQIFFGAPVWNAKSWRGTLYPADAAAAKFLYHYARQFSCVELNTSHYRIPTASTVDRWMDQVTEDFLFCPKIFKGISHARHGLLHEGLLESWFEFATRLKAHAGPSFLQLPPYFEYASKAELFAFVEKWPRHLELALEFRHPSWFTDGQIRPALVRYLHSRGVALVITDVAGRRDVSHASLSGRCSLLRFVGNELHPSDSSRAEAWAARFERWRQLGLRKLFLFIHEPNDTTVPEMIELFLTKLRAYLNFDVRWPATTAVAADQMSLLG